MNSSIDMSIFSKPPKTFKPNTAKRTKITSFLHFGRRVAIKIKPKYPNKVNVFQKFKNLKIPRKRLEVGEEKVASNKTNTVRTNLGL